MTQGFLNLNKPFNWTSHDCVARVRKLLRLKKVGHAGTLDPAATGVLPIAIGKATRLLQYLPGGKAYKATIRLGVQTTTDDLQGEIIASQPFPKLDLPQVKTALQQFEGKISQIPPSYSAIQVQGKRLYDLARKGENVEVPPRVVEIFQLEILDWREGEFPELDVMIACGTGTYIRAIARDLGIALQSYGTLAALTRIKSNGFDLADSLTLSDLEAQVQNETFQPMHLDAPLKHLGYITLPAADGEKWCHGQRIPLDLDVSGVLRIYHEHGCFVGIGKVINFNGIVMLIPELVLEQFK
ncbi:tRNA pseudouridine(55) synthase TruB [Aetokthonos hydrillicola Thurmond2011]|jgi:tRNA pseudouridine55 synthase|uniref:tRNA pseudouridine synthase B n=1 Tax=Aetokthonos hydrillicola Thurmond2011 TaxID=2712845 RepID=A0AAP5MCH5_9CYAN|nr:tRNA pseudouridine(55) synthase TruB [Aetokthonos hydrillicola]MBO3460337.1 tRNA pseudouridine(55) synthase TruB [Aetokthonos hydrillicola CCALA 1050]MBW4590791.1 tRNA pseudouridine(55) synthase TruB [Aetokthonos hydrillicola CCALA 1050]MDR9898054.1 tRNA pseudouridine(55) synthase TruB [Aetokthonos hydrillicola Thurmond2011]